jgi:anthranilate synthase component 1
MSDITIVTDEQSFLEAAASTPPGARVPVEVGITVEDPFEAYRRARTTDTDGVFLETTGGQSGWGYFGVDPVERLQVTAAAAPRDGSSPSIEAIDALLDRELLVRGDCDVPYPCGAVGWLSYDVARELEAIPATTVSEGLPRLQLGIFDRLAAWREPRGDDVRLRVTACPVVGESPTTAYEDGRRRATTLARAARDGDRRVRSPPATTGRATFRSECGRSSYVDRVGTVKGYIRDGDTFQANISHRLVAPAAVHPVDTYDALRDVNPAPYSGLVEFPGIDLVSASPELLLDVEGDRVRTEPIAGTRPRGGTTEADAALERELLSDGKERAEHAMLVDLERNDLGKVSEYGSVEVTEYRRVDRYSEVMHLVSLVEGTLREDAGLADAVAAVFPGGTVTGAPKPRTMEIIDEVETTRRGPYTGSIGIFGFDGRATLNMVIRTLVRRDGEYRLRVGGGVVHDSVPEQEYQETLDKGRALVTAVDEALGDRGSFAVEPATGPMEGIR